MKKVTLLFLALLLPILVFLFLKKFGKNEFTIPVYYENAADSLSAVCGFKYEAPHRIPDSVLAALHWENKPATVLILDSIEMKNELSRLSDNFRKDEFQLLDITNRSSSKQAQWRRCVFFARPGKGLILLDSTRRIRGFYKGTRAEVDRLLLEMDILLKKY